MEFNAYRSYFRNLIRFKHSYDFYWIVFPLLAITWVEDGWRIIPGLFLAGVVLSKLLHRFTIAIRLEGDYLEIDYRRFFRKWTIRFDRSSVMLKLLPYHDDVREPKYAIMQVMEEGKVKYQVDGREGFHIKVLREFMHEFTLAL